MSIFLAILLGLYTIGLHILLGGPNLAFALPAYGFLGLIGLASLLVFRRQRSGADPWCLLSAIALSGYIQARAATAPYPFFSDRELLLAQAALAFYLLFVLFITSPRDRLIFICMMFGLSLAHVGLALYQFSRDNNFNLWGIMRSHYGWRGSGLVICPNHMAAFLVVFILFAAALLFWGRLGATRRVGLIGLILAFTVGLIVSASRGSMLGLVLGGVALFCLSLPVWKNYYQWPVWRTALVPMAVLLVCVIVLLIAIRLPALQQVVHRFNNAPADLDWRLRAWHVGLIQFQEAPIFGTGAGTYVIYGRTYRTPEIQVDFVHAHNEYVEMLGEYGLMGMALFLAFLAAHLRRWWLSYRQLGYQRLPAAGGGSNALALNLGALAAVISLMGAAIFDFEMQIPGVTMAGAFAVAIMASSGYTERRSSRRSDLVRAASTEADALAEPAEPARQPTWAHWVTTTSRALPAILGIVLIAATARYAYPEYLNYRGQIIMFIDANPLAAIPWYKKSIAWNPRNYQPYYYLGEIRYKIGLQLRDPTMRQDMFLQARDSLQGSRERFPDHDRTLWHLAKIHDYFGELEESAALWDHLLKIDPDQKLLRLEYGKHLYTIGDLDGAMREFDLALALGARGAQVSRLKELVRKAQAGEASATPGQPLPQEDSIPITPESLQKNGATLPAGDAGSLPMQ